MSVEFQDAILAGVTLVREAIQSQNFVAGESGWQIKSDGTAEFSDLTIRSSDGSSSIVTVANGQILVTDGAGTVRAAFDADGYRLYDDTGTVVAQVKAGISGAGFWTRDFDFAGPTTAELTGAELQFAPLDTTAVDGGGFISYTYQPAAGTDPAYVQAQVSTGYISSANGDTPALLTLNATQGKRPYAHIGDSSRPCDLQVAGQISGGGVPTYIRKTADTNRQSATFADDPDLTCQLEAGSTYEVEFSLFYSAEVAGGFRTQWTVPSGVHPGYRGVIGAGSSATDSALDNSAGRFGVHGYTTVVEYGDRDSNSLCMATERGMLTTGAVGGTLALSWCQVVSGASVYSTVAEGSFLKVTKVA